MLFMSLLLRIFLNWLLRILSVLFTVIFGFLIYYGIMVYLLLCSGVVLVYI